MVNTDENKSPFLFRADDDEGEEYVKGSELLTDFQRAKFKHFFYHVLDLNSDHVISQVTFRDYFKLPVHKQIRYFMK